MTVLPLPIRIRRFPLAMAAAAILVGAAGPGCSTTGSGESALAPSTGELRRVTEAVPAFGGVRFEGSDLVVFVLGAGRTGAARDSLTRIFGRRRAAAVDLRVRPPQGDASEDLKRSARPVLAEEAVQSLNVDQRTGYLNVGVTSVEGVRRAEDRLEALGIPMAAVVLRVEGRIVAL